MKKVSNENLDILIEGLQQYKDEGTIDPWVLDNGTIIEPLDILKELRAYRIIYPAKKEGK